MRLFSDATEYGLRAIVWLAQQPPGAYKLQAIADATRAAPGYMIKVLQTLAKAGIVTAHRGTLGGFALARDPDTLSMLDIVAAIDPIERIRKCPLGIEAHGCELCPMHRSIDDALAGVERCFGRLTVSALLRKAPWTPALCVERSTQSSPATPSRVGRSPKPANTRCGRQTAKGASRGRITKR